MIEMHGSISLSSFVILTVLLFDHTPINQSLPSVLSQIQGQESTSLSDDDLQLQQSIPLPDHTPINQSLPSALSKIQGHTQESTSLSDDDLQLQQSIPLPVRTSSEARKGKSCDFDMVVSIGKDGSYKVSVGETPWLYSGETWFQANGKRYTTADDSLKLVSYKEFDGKDSLGPYDIHQFTYIAKPDLQFVLFILRYKERPIILFGQNYANETQGTSVHDDTKTCSGFPSFDLSKSSADLGYFAPKGYFSGWDDKEFGRWSSKTVKLNDSQNLGPIAIFDKNDNAVIMSHFMEFMAASMYYDVNKTTLYVGPLGRAARIPAHFLIWTMFYHSCDGIRKAYQGWGDSLKKFYKSKSEEFAKTDFTNNYLGYWTDNGAFYYYNTEPNATYEKTILDTIAYHRSNKIPVRYLQYDSWWYPKDEKGGILEYLAKKSIFPSGMRNIVKKSHIGASGHCKWWSPQTPLAKQNGGKYDFLIESKMALPVDPRFYKDIIADARSWGLQMFNQDWLGQWFKGLDAFRTNVTIGKRFMHLLNEGCLENGVMMEICTAYPRHVLAALEMNAVIINRVTQDYNPGNNNWELGEIAVYVSALGQSPFKDVFWTTSDQDCPKYPGKREPYPIFQSLVASLSAGPVAFGDAVGKTDRNLLMRCCNDEGLILKPSVPATSIDAVFKQKAFQDGSGPGGSVWTTYSKIGPFTYGVIFGAAFADPFNVTPENTGFSEWMTDYNYVVFPYNDPSKFQSFSVKSPLKLSDCSHTDICLYYVSPVYDMGGNKIVLHGELTKWIAVSPKRISDITLFAGDLQITWRGAPNEIVNGSVSINGKLVNLKCKIQPSGMALWSVLGGSCQ